MIIHPLFILLSPHLRPNLVCTRSQLFYRRLSTSRFSPAVPSSFFSRRPAAPPPSSHLAVSFFPCPSSFPHTPFASPPSPSPFFIPFFLLHVTFSFWSFPGLAVVSRRVVFVEGFRPLSTAFVHFQLFLVVRQPSDVVHIPYIIFRVPFGTDWMTALVSIPQSDFHSPFAVDPHWSHSKIPLP